jgi:hypothetical protein
MFDSLNYVSFDPDHEYNMFNLYDTCFAKTITTPNGSPSLANKMNSISNTLALLAVIKNYETMNRNVPLNIARYYHWLYCEGYDVSKKLIKQQLSTLDRAMGFKFYNKYYHSILIYLVEHHLMPDIE